MDIRKIRSMATSLVGISMVNDGANRKINLSEQQLNAIIDYAYDMGREYASGKPTNYCIHKDGKCPDVLIAQRLRKDIMSWANNNKDILDLYIILNEVKCDL